MNDLIKLIENYTGIQLNDCDPNTNIRINYSLDSLDFIQIVMLIEEKYDIEFSDNMASEIKTLKDLYNTIQALKT